MNRPPDAIGDLRFGAAKVALLTTDMNYDPWGGYDGHGAIEWEKLGATAKQVAVKHAGAKNKWHLDHLDRLNRRKIFLPTNSIILALPETFRCATRTDDTESSPVFEATVVAPGSDGWST